MSAINKERDKRLAQTLLQNEGDGHVREEGGHAPLMVAMQPGVEVPVVGVEEVVVVTDVDVGGDVVEGGDINTTVEAESDHDVAVAAMEEVGDEDNTVSLVKIQGQPSPSKGMGDIWMKVGRMASANRPPESSSEDSDSEDNTSDQSDTDAADRQTPYMSQTKRESKEPKKRVFAYRLQWSNKDMLEAMKSVEESKMTLRGAAKKYGVPYSTLKDRVHGRVRHGTKPGVKTALSPEEEEELVKYIKDMECAGYQLRCVDIRDRAGELLRLNHGHNSPYRERSPGHNWLAGFLKRHPGIEYRRTANRSLVPSTPKQKQSLRKFYDIAAYAYKKSKCHHKPERIFTVAELRANVFQRATILVATSATGKMLPPFVVFRGQKLKMTSARQVYPEAFFTSNLTGQVDEMTFMWWFREHFLRQAGGGTGRPMVLFISRPVSDVSLQMVQLAKEERVSLIALPQGVAHLLQPMDDQFMQNIDDNLVSKSKKWEEENPGTPFTQKVLAQILQRVWKKSNFSSDLISGKFAKNGLFPLNAAAISTDRILTATQELRERMHHAAPSPFDDSELAGLNLLSTLSSHEYASIGNSAGNYNNSFDRSFDQYTDSMDNRDQAVASTSGSLDYATPARAAQSPKRRKLEVYVDNIEDIEDRSAGPHKFAQGVLQHMLQQDQVIEQPDQHQYVIRPRSSKRRSSQQQQQQQVQKQQQPAVESPDVQTQIVNARDNIEQINRAISSILEQSGQEEAVVDSVILNTGGKGLPRNIRIVKVKASHASAGMAIKTETEPSPPRVGIEVVGDQQLGTPQMVQEEVVQEEIVHQAQMDDGYLQQELPLEVNVKTEVASITQRILDSGRGGDLAVGSIRRSDFLVGGRVDEKPPHEIMQPEEFLIEEEAVDAVPQEVLEVLQQQQQEQEQEQEEEIVEEQQEVVEEELTDDKTQLQELQTVMINGQLFRVVKLPPGHNVVSVSSGRSNHPVIKVEQGGHDAAATSSAVVMQEQEQEEQELEMQPVQEDLVYEEDGMQVVHQADYQEVEEEQDVTTQYVTTQPGDDDGTQVVEQDMTQYVTAQHGDDDGTQVVEQTLEYIQVDGMEEVQEVVLEEEQVT